MLKKIIFAGLYISIFTFTGCFSEVNTNSGVSNMNSGGRNMPEGLDAKPIQPDGKTTPGISDSKMTDADNVPKGETPTPGIPDSKEIGKTPLPQGATTPGIPSPEELKQQRERKVDPNEVNRPVQKSDNEETTSPIDRKRRAGKPPAN